MGGGVALRRRGNTATTASGNQAQAARKLRMPASQQALRKPAHELTSALHRCRLLNPPTLWYSSTNHYPIHTALRHIGTPHPLPASHPLTLWYSSTAPLRCAATSAVPSVPGSHASAMQREALLLPSGLNESEVTGRVEVGGARSCARSDSSTTAAGEETLGRACGWDERSSVSTRYARHSAAKGASPASLHGTAWAGPCATRV